VEFEPARGEAVGEKLLESFLDSGDIAAGGCAEQRGGVALWRQVEMDGLAFFPVGGDLENRRAAEAAMGEEHFFAEGVFVGRGDDFGGDAGKFGVAVVVGAIEDERNEGGARGDDFVAELAGQVVAEGSGAHFGD